ncbi:MAG: thioredoxin family protein [Agathobacter sp.]
MKNCLNYLIILVIVLAIVGVWFLKNGEPDDEKEGSSMDADFSLEVTSEVDYAALTKLGLPIIVDYGSDSCIPCKQMAPVLEKMNEEMQGKAIIKFVDVRKYPESLKKVPIQVIPTQVLFHADGTPFVPSDELARKISFDMYNARETGEHVFTVHQGGLTEEEMRLILAEMGVSD